MNGVYFDLSRACVCAPGSPGKLWRTQPCVQTQTAVTWCLQSLILTEGLVLGYGHVCKISTYVIVHIPCVTFHTFKRLINDWFLFFQVFFKMSAVDLELCIDACWCGNCLRGICVVYWHDFFHFSVLNLYAQVLFLVNYSNLEVTHKYHLVF